MFNTIMGFVWLGVAIFFIETQSLAYWSSIICANVWFATGSIINIKTK
jgi:hypothetical protein